MALASVALGATGLFAGGALFSLVADAHALATAPPDAAATFFRHWISRAVVLQSALGATGALSSLALVFDESLGHQSRGAWLLSSICIGAVGAWTAVAMVRVNKALCGKGADAKPPTGAEAASLLKVWGVRHGVRTAAALAALGAALAAAGPLARA